MPWYWYLMIHYPLLAGFQVGPTFQYSEQCRRTNPACVLGIGESGMGEHCRERESRLIVHLFHLFLHLQGPLVAQAQEGRSDLETASLTENNKIITKQRIMKIVVTHLELDILECEIRWALGSITTNKASGGDRIPAEFFQIQRWCS